MPSETRARRLGERIRQELADLLARQASDPRLDGVTVTAVEIDREFAHATAFINALGDEARKQDILQGLTSARGFLRSELSRRVPLRAFPQLRFRWDESFDQASNIEALLRQVREEDERGRSSA
ncbi:MAG: 30S ribosome-binding factor RbfA [Anaerolineales bacterium]|nr:30S ribosome-binding factor RbfA [Anaerolineales bacterium]